MMRKGAYKFAVLGAAGVGKSALTIRLTYDHFLDEYDLREVEPFTQQVSIGDEACTINIVELPVTYHQAIVDEYTRAREGFVLMYSIASRASFEQVSGFYHRIHQARRHPLPPPAIVIVGNKCDLGEDVRAVSTKEGAELAQSLGCAFLEASAKTRINVEETFLELVRQVRQASASNDEHEDKDNRRRDRSSASSSSSSSSFSNDRCIVS